MPKTNVIELPGAPSSLSAEARRLWQSLSDEYVIDDAAGLAILGELCQTVDRLREIQKAIHAAGLMVDGYNGQPRPNPLLKSEAEARRLVLAHFRALRLNPEDFA